MRVQALAGLDACRAGWIAVRDPGPDAVTCLFARFEDALAAWPDAILAIDIPIGLPERIAGPGRPAEQAVRPLLGPRRASVFSIPCRAAVMAANYAAACNAARAGSSPPKALSKQCFNILPKIREVDAAMTAALEARVFEVHPELAFATLNGGQPMAFAKRRPEGRAERRALLLRHGYSADFVDGPMPRGCGRDDFFDAAANALIAGRIGAGRARSHPAVPPRDARGLMIAIWA